MKIELSENGHSKEWKPLKGLAVSFAQMEDGPFGKDYYFLIFDGESEIAKLLEKFDSTPELEFYFFKNIFYISIDSAPYLYMIEVFDDDLENLRKQLNKEKKIVIAINDNEKIESIFLYDIIM